MSPFETFNFHTSVLADGETTMFDANVLQALGQVSSSEAGTIFRDFLRGSVLEMISEVIAAEVEDLCGPKHSPKRSTLLGSL
jgi:hypothetical protein